MKRLLLITHIHTKDKYLKLINVVRFCGWEDARVWAYWNHAFDMHLTHLEPVSCFSPSWITLRVHSCGGGGGVTTMADGLMAHHLLFIEMADGIPCPPSATSYYIRLTVGQCVLPRLRSPNIAFPHLFPITLTNLQSWGAWFCVFGFKCWP